MEPSYDLCVLGAGSAGSSAAQEARRAGRSVVLVETGGKLAGLCILRGCMPAKTLLHSADVAQTVRDADTCGIDSGTVRVDGEKIVARKDRLVREFAEDRLQELEQYPLVRGNARFVSDRMLAVDGKALHVDRFVLAMGSKTVPPDIPGLSACGYITQAGALDLEPLPKSMIVVGAGPVGCEFAQYFARLGVEVTLLEQAEQLLFKEDADVAYALRNALEGDGVRVVTGVSIERAECLGSRKALSIVAEGRAQQIEAQELMIAMTRRPNVAGFDLEKARVDYCGDGITVSALMQTSNPRIFAAGDVIGRRMLVHMAVLGGQVAAQNAAGASREIDFDLQEAHGIGMEPELAVAGLSERDARARNIRYEMATYPFSDHGRAKTEERPQGFVKMLAALDGRILGVTIVGEGALELIHEALALLYARSTVDDVLRVPHLHPTMAEIITYPAEELQKRLRG
ncbi:MAG: FAD-dependent oxidoreductase [Candidatus Eremiobacteraeota bacterium]|nr:FAD-dependent oxidoreductase [Candidatus Eremiobacteraeota bacterium]